MDALDVILSETSLPEDRVGNMAAALIEAKIESVSTPKAKEMAISTPVTASVTRTPRSSTPRAKTKAAPRYATVPLATAKSATITKPATVIKPASVTKPTTVNEPVITPPSTAQQSESGQGEEVQQQLKRAKEESDRLLKELQKHQAKEVLYLN